MTKGILVIQDHILLWNKRMCIFRDFGTPRNKGLKIILL